MAALRAVATGKGMDAEYPFPLMRAAMSYLTVDDLMPPMRLRWSRALGRPLMNTVTEREGNVVDHIGAVFIEEVMGKRCFLSYTERFGDSRVHVDNMPAHEGVRAHYWEVSIVDSTFAHLQVDTAWQARYGKPWPLVAERRPHPALSRLCARYYTFLAEWTVHVDQCESEFYDQISGHSDSEGSEREDSDGGVSD
jgi:hypothetical protein